MSHWRDGGIGNRAGSDDRPLSEWTLLERLNNLEALVHKHGATTADLQELAYEAANIILSAKLCIESAKACVKLFGKFP